MNKNTTLQICFLILMFTLQACGGNGSPVPSPEEPSPIVETPTADLQDVPIPTAEPPAPDPATPTAESPTPPPVFEPPVGFIEYRDTDAGVSVYLPEGWIATNIDPGRFAVLQSYPEDKYVGGEVRQPGDTKCDLNIHQAGLGPADLIDQWKSNADTTIVSEQEVLLQSGQTATRIETENLGRAISMVTIVEEKTVALTCFGDFSTFDEISGTIIASDAIAPEAGSEPPAEAAVSAVVILAEAGLNIRTGPDTASEVVGVIPQNELVPVLGESPDGEWWQVACPEGTAGDCWISADPRWSEPAAPLEFSLAGLVYSRLDQQPERPLWRVGIDGTATLLLENSQNLGALSPDGTQVITCCLPRGETNLGLLGLAAGETRQLTDTADRLAFNPQWWAANPETIIFVSTTVAPDDQPRIGPGNLAAVQSDGTGYQLLDDEHVMHTFTPALAPDGRKIAYNHGGENASEDGLLAPWIYDLQDGPIPFNYAEYGLDELPNLSFGAAAWSPDGKYLAWVIGGELTGNEAWETGLAMFDLEGQSVDILTITVPANCLFVWCRAAPVWNPTGAWLTWEISPAGGLPSFSIMGPDGGGQRLIEQASAPFWSPDGTLLVYTEISTGAVMVMETGQWQAQRTGLPGQIGIVKWLGSNE